MILIVGFLRKFNNDCNNNINIYFNNIIIKEISSEVSIIILTIIFVMSPNE